MFDKMVKMKNRKGFTLVEMLVVIAIIAILVSIVVPIIGASTVKAAAATNAANLRSIEGLLATKRVENPLVFESVIEQFGSNLSSTLQNWGLSEGASIIASTLIGLVIGEEGINSFINGDSALSQYAKYKIYHNTASADGVLEIPAETTIVLTDVPAAKAVKTGNMNIEKGTPMTVYITEDTIVATYESNGGSFTRLDFAEVAETGEYTGTSTGSGGTNEETLEGNALCSLNMHNYGDDCKCTRCPAVNHSANGRHTCSKCGITINASCADDTGWGDDDCLCDYPDCTTPNNCVNSDDCKDEAGNDYKCDYCGSTYAPTLAKYIDDHCDNPAHLDLNGDHRTKNYSVIITTINSGDCYNKLKAEWEAKFDS